MADTIEAQVQKLTVEPGDVLVLKVKGRVSKEMPESFKRHADSIFEKSPYRPKVMVLDGDCDLSVLSLSGGKMEELLKQEVRAGRMTINAARSVLNLLEQEGEAA